MILDNHSAHISKETRAYLAGRPNRFRYVHTPKHGSWLNLVETLFGKMSRTFLRQIRGGVQGGTQNADSSGDCRDQRSPRSPSLEKI